MLINICFTPRCTCANFWFCPGLGWGGLGCPPPTHTHTHTPTPTPTHANPTEKYAENTPPSQDLLLPQSQKKRILKFSTQCAKSSANDNSMLGLIKDGYPTIKGPYVLAACRLPRPTALSLTTKCSWPTLSLPAKYEVHWPHRKL